MKKKVCRHLEAVVGLFSLDRCLRLLGLSDSQDIRASVRWDLRPLFWTSSFRAEFGRLLAARNLLHFALRAAGSKLPVRPLC